jgi:hypothetical protein
MSAYLILEECKTLKARLALELQAAKDDRRAQHKDFEELMAELWGTLRTIQARFRVDAELLNLVRPHKTGEQEWQGKRNSNRSRMLDEFAKRGT